MKLFLLTSLLIVSFSTLYAQIKEKGYKRLSKKLVNAEREMNREYRHTSKSLNVNEKRELGKAQHVWKQKREEACFKSSLQKKIQDTCKYKKIIERTEFLKLYTPELRELDGMSSFESNTSTSSLKLHNLGSTEKEDGDLAA